MQLNDGVTLGLDFASVFFCGVGASESEPSSESESESEELSADELLAWATGPFPFSSVSLEHTGKSPQTYTYKSIQRPQHAYEYIIVLPVYSAQYLH